MANEDYGFKPGAKKPLNRYLYRQEIEKAIESVPEPAVEKPKKVRKSGKSKKTKK